MSEFGGNAVEAAKMFESLVMVGTEFVLLAADQADWSEEVFGTTEERGPLGSLKHLELEARECQANPSDISEYAYCLILILDASRRAGFPLKQLIQAGHDKMKENRAREWHDIKPDEPVFHAKQQVGGAGCLCIICNRPLSSGTERDNEHPGYHDRCLNGGGMPGGRV